jgi:hypothetical protein
MLLFVPTEENVSRQERQGNGAPRSKKTFARPSRAPSLSCARKTFRAKNAKNAKGTEHTDPKNLRGLGSLGANPLPFLFGVAAFPVAFLRANRCSSKLSRVGERITGHVQT